MICYFSQVWIREPALSLSRRRLDQIIDIVECQGTGRTGALSYSGTLRSIVRLSSHRA